MLKELICAVALSGTIGMTAPQNSNDGTYYQDVTITETYEYETNEVNSVDDLVVGNIYKLENFGSNQDGVTITTDYAYAVIRNNYYNVITVTKLYEEDLMLIESNKISVIHENTTSNVNFTHLTLCYFTYLDHSGNLDCSLISASDYLGEKTITITPKEYNGLFSIFDNFLHERLFSGGILDTTNVTVFNATISLGQWLSTTTSIVLLCLIVLLLILLIKFIFKYVGGMMIWRS